MTPKEKAKELLWKYLPILEGWKQEDSNQAKQCALIAVDEILEMHLPILEEDADTFYDYWEEVKHEVNNL